MAPNSSVAPKDHIDYQPKGFKGTLFDEGRYVRCQTPVRAGHPTRPAGEICLAPLQNQRPSIASHWTKQHNPNSAKSRDMEKDPSLPWKCPCNASQDSWDNHLAHIRDSHGFEGSSSEVKDAGGLLYSGIQLDPVTRKVIKGEGYGNVNNYNKNRSVPQQQAGPQGPRPDNDNPSYTYGPPQPSHGGNAFPPIDPAISHGTTPTSGMGNATYEHYDSPPAHFMLRSEDRHLRQTHPEPHVPPFFPGSQYWTQNPATGLWEPRQS